MNRSEVLISKMVDKVKTNIIDKNDLAYVRDPIFNIVRNRVNAEICKSLFRLYPMDPLIQKFIKNLIVNQNRDGSWNEIHPNYDQPSALITSFIGEALLLNLDSYADTKELVKSLETAKDYVLSQEKKPGYFVKSSSYTADHLNVDASCGVFLAQYAVKFSDTACLDSAKRSAKRICDNQFNGAYPYTTDKGTYSYALNVPCIHYQGVTIYYLSKIYSVLREEYIKESLLDGVEWLSSVQKENGRFDWSKSGLLFAHYLTGAYAFAFSSFIFASKWDDKYLKSAELCLDVLNENIDGFAFRWEKQSLITLFGSIFIPIKAAFIGDYPMKHRLFRYGYGMYRQIATRGFSDNPVDDRFFKILIKVMKLDNSVIEASKNFHDLFMTSEILDCLTQSTQWSELNE